MEVPRYKQVTRGSFVWVIEIYSDTGELLSTREPTQQEQTWINKYPVATSNCAAEFDLIAQRKLKNDPVVIEALRNIRRMRYGR